MRFQPIEALKDGIEAAAHLVEADLQALFLLLEHPPHVRKRDFAMEAEQDRKEIVSHGANATLRVGRMGSLVTATHA